MRLPLASVFTGLGPVVPPVASVYRTALDPDGTFSTVTAVLGSNAPTLDSSASAPNWPTIGIYASTVAVIV